MTPSSDPRAAVPRGPQDVLIAAVRDVVSFLKSIDWTDRNSEDEAANHRYALEQAIEDLVAVERISETGWQPIETWNGMNGEAVLIGFVETTQRKRQRRSYVAEGEYKQGAWWFMGDYTNKNGAADPQPTHWMPLPAPPRQGTGHDGPGPEKPQP